MEILREICLKDSRGHHSILYDSLTSLSFGRRSRSLTIGITRFAVLPTPSSNPTAPRAVKPRLYAAAAALILFTAAVGPLIFVWICSSIRYILYAFYADLSYYLT